MKSFFRTLLTACLVCMLHLAIGQGVGTPGTTIQFDTSPAASGGVAPLGHLQAGAFGNIFTGTWASVGQAPVIPGIPNTPYGIRLQRQATFGVINFVDNGTADELIYGFGRGPAFGTPGNVPALRFRYISDQFTNTFEDILNITLSPLDGRALVSVGLDNAPRAARLNAFNKGKTADINQFIGEGIALYAEQNGDNTFATYRSYGIFSQHLDAASFGHGVYGQSTGASTNYGVYGAATASSAVNYGVRGDATGGTSANYGVFGRASTGPNDYAVFAAGNLAYTGTFGMVSDRRLKDDVENIESALSTILNLRPTSYTYRQDAYEGMNLPQGLSYGFIAQEVEEVMPELVMEITQPFDPKVEGEDMRFETFKGLKYTELIPVLTAAIQEQQELIQTQQEALEAMQAEIRDLRAASSTENAETGSLNPKFNSFGQAQLFQNRPNPFKEATVIKYQLPKDAQSAEIYVFDMQGRQIATYANLDQAGELTIQAAALNAGMYLYSLVINGQEVDTKRMILTK